MQEINYLIEYAVPVVMGICMCVGYVIKSSVPGISNKHIPLIMAVLGLILNAWINMQINPDIILGGMFSGLASTGLHQVFKNTIKGVVE